MERDIRKPVRLPPTEGPAETEIFKRQMREDLENMRKPGYPAKAAGSELEEIQRFANHAILIPLAGLLGVVLVSAEVGQGSIYLLLPRPLGRRRMLLTKYSVCAACLLAVALAGAVEMLLSAYAHGYPSEAVNAGRIFAAAALIWLGSLFVLGVSLLASTIFRSVIQTILATAATVYLVHTGPDIVRSAAEAVFWIAGRTISTVAQVWTPSGEVSVPTALRRRPCGCDPRPRWRERQRRGLRRMGQGHHLRRPRRPRRALGGATGGTVGGLR